MESKEEHIETAETKYGSGDDMQMKPTDIFMICLVLLTYNRDFRFKKEIMVCAAVYYTCRLLQFMF